MVNSTFIGKVSVNFIDCEPEKNKGYLKEDILKIAEFAKTLNQQNLMGINLLPYHSMGENKYKMLGRDYKLHGLHMMNRDDINVLREQVEQTGIPCKVG